jgi:murein L,D-transpeptidase YcbB/YkuD
MDGFHLRFCGCRSTAQCVIGEEQGSDALSQKRATHPISCQLCAQNGPYANASVGLMLCCVIIFMVVCASSATSARDLVANTAVYLQALRLTQDENTILLGRPIAATEILSKLYAANGYELLWQDTENRDALYREISRSAEDGLAPRDFHWPTFRELAVQSQTSTIDREIEAKFDIIVSDALVRLGYQLLYGKVRPDKLDPDWNYSRPLFGQDPVNVILSALKTNAIPQLFSQLRIKHPYYLALKSALRSHREIAASGGWRSLPTGPALRKGMSGKRVANLRYRLAESGDLGLGERSDPVLFDKSIENAARRFQVRHGLDADGIVGRKTLEALNISVEARIEQIRVNMERARWVLRDIGDDFIIVNIAGFYLRLIEDSNVRWQSSVIVGTPYRKTPVFTAPMRYLEFNPTWTVPPTIMLEDILPKVKSEPGYLQRNDFRLVNFQRQPVDMAAIDWKDVESGKFPYLIVQQPGPRNSLGLVKFMFPNEHAVYIHDTPNRGQFKSTSRTFSSGCIRVEKPFELADLLLSGRKDWQPDQVAKIIASKATTRINMPKSLPVLLLYWTVDPEPGGGVQFYPDIYNRDAKVLKALNSSHASVRKP